MDSELAAGQLEFRIAVIPREFKQVAEQLQDGERHTASVREMLSWCGALRRRPLVMGHIRSYLELLGMRTEPDFEDPPLDGIVEFKLLGEDSIDTSTHRQNGQPTPYELNRSTSAPPASKIDPSYRLSRLPSANLAPLSVKQDTLVVEATTLMMTHDFSQLPVMASERTVNGMLNWKSIGRRLALGLSTERVRDCMLQHCELKSSDSIFDAVREIAGHDAVLVRGPTNKIEGIVTASDISCQFQLLAEPFLVLGEIENQLRALIASKFSQADLLTAKDPNDDARQIEDVSDLTFGEYVRLLENPHNWLKLDARIDRVVFIKALKEVNAIRNDVMHFDPDGVDERELAKLRHFSRFLTELRQLLGNR